ncbi:MAG: hypothetical protein AB8B92_06365 [Gammaproteobacteria bacterium]
MSTTESIRIIDLYGSGVRISDGENILVDSKSYALIESDKSITIGEQAEHLAHLRPRECSTLFWSQLAENSNTKLVISNAEIAYRHLESVWKLAEGSDQLVILITPVTLSKNELGLLLGICNKLYINVAGIVCNASLALQHHINDCKAVFIDLQQQQLALTELNQNKQGVSLEQPSRILNYGLHKFTQNAANSIAKKFVSETRFDPLHNAADEQQFFDKLPLWLTTLVETDIIECKLSTGEKHFSIQCESDLLRDANRNLFEDLAAHLNVLFHNHNNIAIFCSESCRQVFGLQDYLINLPGCAVIQQNNLSLSKQAVLFKHEITKGEQVHFVNVLPWQETDDIPTLTFSSGKLSNLSSIPTHVLLNGYAHSLQQDLFISPGPNARPKILLEKNPNSLCKIYTDGLSVIINIYDTEDIILNERCLKSTTVVNINDLLKIQGHAEKLQFIKVVGHEE